MEVDDTLYEPMHTGDSLAPRAFTEENDIPSWDRTLFAELKASASAEPMPEPHAGARSGRFQLRGPEGANSWDRGEHRIGPTSGGIRPQRKAQAVFETFVTAGFARQRRKQSWQSGKQGARI